MNIDYLKNKTFNELFKEIKDQITLLSEVIVLASELYYKDGTSPLLDREFDLLIETLRSLNKDHPILSMTGWGYRPKEGVKHPYGHIGGIDVKLKDKNQIPLESKKFCVSAKLDGGSVTVYYKNGYFQYALSRGDGVHGEDVSRNALRKSPIDLKRNFTGYVRCEAVISYENFKKFPVDRRIRNSAVGLLKGTANDLELFKYLDFIPVRIFDANSNRFYSKGSGEFIGICGQSPFIRMKFSESQMGNPKLYISKEIMQNLAMGYPSDGLVIETFDLSSCYAFKFDDELVDVIVSKIEWNTQPSGKIFPLVHYSPVLISGCISSKATGKSHEFINNNKIGVNAIIKIVRSGEVIPNIMEVITPSNIIQPPRCSEGCDSRYLSIEGANIYCRNPGCKSFIKGLFNRLVMMYAPKGFSQEMINLIFKYSDGSVMAFLNNLKSINKTQEFPTIGLTEHQIDLISKVIESLSTLNLSLESLVYICSVEGFGYQLSKTMESKFKSSQELQKYCMTHKDLDAEMCPNSRARESWKHRFDWIQLFLGYFNLEIKILIKEDLINIDKTLSKEIVCITGKIDGMTKDEFAKKEIFTRAYAYTTNINEATILINAGDRESNKVKTAQSRGVKIMTIEEFLK